MSETESRWRCKVIVFRRDAGRVRFGVVPAPGGEAAVAFATAPFPNLLAIDVDLEAFARETLAIGRVRIHERFVERPHPQGDLYYLIEAEDETLPEAGGERLTWLEAPQAAPRLSPPDRAALARAIRYLSGTGPAA